MPKAAREPRWLNRTILDAIHDGQIREHGGLPGLRDENALESALVRPRNKWVYGARGLATLAAAYAYGIVTGHPYVDGNKRVCFLALVTFLGVNDYDFIATDLEVLNEIVAIAAGHVSEKKLAGWNRSHMRRSYHQ